MFTNSGNNRDYYLQTQEGQQAGPYSIEQLKAFWITGKVTMYTPYWTDGMAEWKPIRTIEKSIRMAPHQPSAPAAASMPASKTPRKGLGCGSGCLIVVCLGFVGVCGLFVLGAMSGSPPMPPVSDGADYKKWYANGYGLGCACSQIQQNKGLPEDTDEGEIQAGANRCVTTLGMADGSPAAGGVRAGFKQGYRDYWVDSKRALAEMSRLLRDAKASTSSAPVIPSQSQQAHAPTKSEWKANVPQNANLAALGRIACSRQALFDAVGQPSRVQEAGDYEYLYWDCSDGQIQVICARGQYELGMVGGSVNDN